MINSNDQSELPDDQLQKKTGHEKRIRICVKYVDKLRIYTECF